jgi:HEAT repeat protein
VNRKTQHCGLLLGGALLASLLGCSKDPEVGNSDPGGRAAPPSIAAASSATGTEAPVNPPAEGPSVAAPEGMDAVRSAAEIAQELKAGGDRDAAYAAIRTYARANPAAFTELSAWLHSGEADLVALGAQGLAALSTPEAAADVIGVFQATPPGLPRRELGSALAGFNNPALAGLLLDVLGASEDRELVFSCQQALAKAADTPLLNEVVRQYEASNSGKERENLAGAIRHMQNASCVEGLLGVLNQQRVISSIDPLGLAAVDTLGIIGNQVAVSNLFAYVSLQREGASGPVLEAIGRVMNAESLPLLASVAYGRGPGASRDSRVAAVTALGNFTPPQVEPVLNWLIQNESNPSIREEATKALRRVTGQ